MDKKVNKIIDCNYTFFYLYYKSKKEYFYYE